VRTTHHRSLVLAHWCVVRALQDLV